MFDKTFLHQHQSARAYLNYGTYFLDELHGKPTIMIQPIQLYKFFLYFNSETARPFSFFRFFWVCREDNQKLHTMYLF